MPLTLSSQTPQIILDSETQDNNYSTESYIANYDDLMQLQTDTPLIFDIPEIVPVLLEKNENTQELQNQEMTSGSMMQASTQMITEQDGEIIDLNDIAMQDELVANMQEAEEDNIENDPDYVANNDNSSEASSTEGNRESEEKLIVNEKPFSSKNVRERKENRNLGKKYKTAKGKVKDSRKLKPLRQNCRNKCKEKLHEVQRQKIFDEYWQLGTYDRRVAFIASLITVRETKITRAKLDGKPPKNRLNTYTG